MQKSESQTQKAWLAYVPWIVVGLISLFSLIFLNRWIGQENLVTMGEINGWEWRPGSSHPLYHLLTKPISFFPVGVQPMLLSLFSWTCGVLSLLLLARTVMILPQERTRLQRQHQLDSRGCLRPEAAWLPATLAIITLGLGRVFWMHTTNASFHSLNLLIFAYAIRNLAEFRASQKDGWLFKAALVYGLGLADSFALIAYLPLFIAAVLWIKGRAAFEFHFLTRMALLGAVGLLLYLSFPLSQMTSDWSIQSGWEALRSHLGLQKHAIASYPRFMAMIVLLISLVPLLALAFRWGEGGGDVSAASAMLTSFLIHVLSVTFLGLGIYLAFEHSKFGIVNFSMADRPLITIYYLSALTVGYFAGYLMCLCGTPTLHRWQRSSSGGNKIVAQTVVAILGIGLIALPAALLYRHGARFTKSYSNSLEQFGKRLRQQIPEGAVVISDNMVWHCLAHAEPQMAARKWLHVDSGSMVQVQYHRYLRHKRPDIWPEVPTQYPKDALLDPSAINYLLGQVTRSNVVYYTEPSFGFFFETHYLEPQGLAYRLLPIPKNQIDVPALTEAQATKIDQLWKDLEQSELKPLLNQPSPSRKKQGPALFNEGETVVRTAYSRVLNHLAVHLTRSHLTNRVSHYIATALQLNPENVSALVNRDYYNQIATGGSPWLQPSEEIRAKVSSYGISRIDLMLRMHGPIDESGNLVVLSQVFARGRNFLQAAQMLRLVASRIPEPIDYRLGAGRLLLQAGRGDLALAEMAEVRKNPASAKGLSNITNAMELLEIEARGLQQSEGLARAESYLKDAMTRYPAEDIPYSTLMDLYVQQAVQLRRHNKTNDVQPMYAAAREVVAQQLKNQPRNVSAWINYGASLIRMDQFDIAIEPLNKALEIDPDNVAGLLNRAIAQFRLGKLDEATRDYERLRTKLAQPPFAVYYGLAEIAAQRKKYPEAIELYNEYLSRTPKSTEAERVKERIKELKAGKG